MARYIDAEKLENAVFTPHIYDINRDDVIALIAEQPTADVEEVKHGKWNAMAHRFYSTSSGKSGNVVFCSVCGEPSASGFKTPYCALCGAKMDGGKNNEK